MKRIEEKHEVVYREPWEDIDDGDVILYWESPMTYCGENGEHYRRVKDWPKRKALLFAGGPTEPQWVDGFDHVFVESAINATEYADMGVSHSTAFGINEDIFKPDRSMPKSFDAFMQATFAAWKRQPLFAEAFGERGVLCGRYQKNDAEPWDGASKSIRLPEMPYEAVNTLINSARCVVNTAEYWGGGQRCTLEAMSSGVPVIVMSDSPKNREYVEESGAGIVCEPNALAIRDAFHEAMAREKEFSERGREYVLGKWTSRHYADNLLQWIENV